MPTQVTDKLISWASEVDDETLRQAARASRLPFVEGHVALMPDAHVGKGATIGSVIPTTGAVIPAAVGVDLGCGMIAVETDLRSEQLPDSLAELMPRIEAAVPAGVGRGHDTRSTGAQEWLARHRPATDLDARLAHKTVTQFGTLGSGNHFLEVCLDERDHVWVVLHSGSRGVGNELASGHIARAKGLMKKLGERLEDPDLAWFMEGTAEFEHYIADML